MTQPAPTTALLTDRYEYTAFATALASGVADRRAVFEVFTRELPPGRRYGVFAGLERLLSAIDAFRFDAATIHWLIREGIADEHLAARLADWRFGGTIRAYGEGEPFFPSSPVLRVEAPFGDAILLETITLSVLNADSAIASAAARMVQAARGKPVVEMGSRRTNEAAGITCARAAYLAGFAGTSNLACGRAWGVPTVGTAMHALVLAYDSELEAFRAQLATLGNGTTLLVDTYDTTNGIRNAVAAARERDAAGPGAVRIDSGNLADEVRNARALLDELGATDTKITVTSDLDELAIDALAGETADTFGVGTRLAGGSGHPACGFVYKLVEIEDASGAMRPVAKRSAAKATLGGAKTPYRIYDAAGRATGEHYSLDGTVPHDARELQRVVILDGALLPYPSLPEARRHHAAALAELDPGCLTVQAGPPAFVATETRPHA